MGTGFSGRKALGQKPLTWRFLESWVSTVQALLRGERTTWEGAVVQMLHPSGFAPPRPIVVPWIIAAEGKVGTEVLKKNPTPPAAPGLPAA